MTKKTLVHVTHEAIGKIGGIGAVLQGFFTCKSYLDSIERSILVGPLFSTEGLVMDRLGDDGEVLYSSIDGLRNSNYRHGFEQIESHYNVGIVYGRRRFVDKQSEIQSSQEVVLIDVRNMNKCCVNKLKRQMYERFGVRSDLYEHIWEYEQYVRLAPAAIEALKVIDAATESTVIISHEFMGMPTVLAGILDSCDFKTAFYAHEVATMRRIVENHPGHDTMFYNAMNHNNGDRRYVDDVFGDQMWYFKHGLISASKHCDSICAVGDYAVEELRFLGPEFEFANIDLVYNGIPAYKIDITEKLKSKEKLQIYCENLLGYKPDFVFTHVTRLVKSKAFWRDIAVLEYIEKEFRTTGETGIMFLLSTEVCQRSSKDIHRMESSYNWPVAHREGMPDLSGGEAKVYAKIQEFNAKSRNIKMVFINQFGFAPKHCGNRMPADMEFMDIRQGSDVEFGLSIYEPFGIAQVEPLSFGGICVFTNVCGCAGFVRDATIGKDFNNVIVADYTDLDDYSLGQIEDFSQIDKSMREYIEENVSEKTAAKIYASLTKDKEEIEKMLNDGYLIAKEMSWDAVVKNYLLKSLQKAFHKQDNNIIIAGN